MSLLDEDKIEKIDKIDKTGKKSPAEAISQSEERLPPNKERFDAALGLPDPKEMEVTGGRKIDSSKTSLIDEVSAMNRKVDQVGRLNPEQLIAKAEGVINDMENLKKKLSAPDLQIKESMQGVLRNKLSHMDESLKVALSRAGIEYIQPQQAPTSTNPIDRFLGMLTKSQSQLESLAGNLRNMHENSQDLSPATMLLMQVKVGFLQQEVELFTGLLGKALESTKTIMNVQV